MMFDDELTPECQPTVKIGDNNVYCEISRSAQAPRPNTSETAGYN